MTLTIAVAAAVCTLVMLAGVVVLVETARRQRLGYAPFPLWVRVAAGALAVVGFVGSCVLAWRGYR